MPMPGALENPFAQNPNGLPSPVPNRGPAGALPPMPSPPVVTPGAQVPAQASAAPVASAPPPAMSAEESAALAMSPEEVAALASPVEQPAPEHVPVPKDVKSARTKLKEIFFGNPGMPTLSGNGGEPKGTEKEREAYMEALKPLLKDGATIAGGIVGGFPGSAAGRLSGDLITIAMDKAKNVADPDERAWWHRMGSDIFEGLAFEAGGRAVGAAVGGVTKAGMQQWGGKGVQAAAEAAGAFPKSPFMNTPEQAAGFPNTPEGNAVAQVGASVHDGSNPNATPDQQAYLQQARAQHEQALVSVVRQFQDEHPVAMGSPQEVPTVRLKETQVPNIGPSEGRKTPPDRLSLAQNKRDMANPSTTTVLSGEAGTRIAGADEMGARSKEPVTVKDYATFWLDQTQKRINKLKSPVIEKAGNASVAQKVQVDNIMRSHLADMVTEDGSFDPSLSKAPTEAKVRISNIYEEFLRRVDRDRGALGDKNGPQVGNSRPVFDQAGEGPAAAHVQNSLATDATEGAAAQPDLFGGSVASRVQPSASEQPRMANSHPQTELVQKLGFSKAPGSPEVPPTPAMALLGHQGVGEVAPVNVGGQKTYLHDGSGAQPTSGTTQMGSQQALAGETSVTPNQSGSLTEAGLPPTSAGRAEAGVTAKTLDWLTSELQKEAAFSDSAKGNSKRHPDERLFGDLAHDMAILRNEAFAKAAAKDMPGGKGDPQLAAQLFSINRRYSANVGINREALALIEKDPKMSAQILMSKMSDEGFNKFVGNLPKAHRENLFNGIISHVLEEGRIPEAADYAGKSADMNPNELMKAITSPQYRDKLVTVMGGAEKYNEFKAVVGQMQALKALPGEIGTPAASTMMARIGKMAMKLDFSGKAVLTLAKDVFTGQKEIADYFGHLSELNPGAALPPSIRSAQSVRGVVGPGRVVGRIGAAAALSGLQGDPPDDTPNPVDQEAKAQAAGSDSGGGRSPQSLGPATGVTDGRAPAYDVGKGIPLNPDIEYKHPQYEGEMAKVHPHLKEIADYVASHMLTQGHRTTVNSVFEKVKGRTSNTHEDGRAFDLSIRGMKDSEVQALADTVNLLYPIAGSKMLTAVYESPAWLKAHKIKGRVPHLHFQVADDE